MVETEEALQTAHQTFSDFHHAQNERTTIFSNFSDVQADGANDFKNKLLLHLSGSIVVKENRNRYQKEQFDRLFVAMQARGLANRDGSMDNFCVEYAEVIEGMIS